MLQANARRALPRSICHYSTAAGRGDAGAFTFGKTTVSSSNGKAQIGSASASLLPGGLREAGAATASQERTSFRSRTNLKEVPGQFDDAPPVPARKSPVISFLAPRPKKSPSTKRSPSSSPLSRPPITATVRPIKSTTRDVSAELASSTPVPTTAPSASAFTGLSQESTKNSVPEEHVMNMRKTDISDVLFEETTAPSTSTSSNTKKWTTIKSNRTLDRQPRSNIGNRSPPAPFTRAAMERGRNGGAMRGGRGGGRGGGAARPALGRRPKEAFSDPDAAYMPTWAGPTKVPSLAPRLSIFASETPLPSSDNGLQQMIPKPLANSVSVKSWLSQSNEGGIPQSVKKAALPPTNHFGKLFETYQRETGDYSIYQPSNPSTKSDASPVEAAQYLALSLSGPRHLSHHSPALRLAQLTSTALQMPTSSISEKAMGDLKERALDGEALKNALEEWRTNERRNDPRWSNKTFGNNGRKGRRKLGIPMDVPDVMGLSLMKM